MIIINVKMKREKRGKILTKKKQRHGALKVF